MALTITRRRRGAKAQESVAPSPAPALIRATKPGRARAEEGGGGKISVVKKILARLDKSRDKGSSNALSASTEALPKPKGGEGSGAPGGSSDAEDGVGASGADVPPSTLPIPQLPPSASPPPPVAAVPHCASSPLLPGTEGKESTAAGEREGAAAGEEEGEEDDDAGTYVPPSLPQLFPEVCA